MAIGNAVGIIMGQLMGSGASAQRVRDENRQVIALAVAVGILFGILLAAAAPFFPRLYNVSSSVRQLASQMILVFAVMMPFNAFTLSAYFTLRSGGQALVTFLFDSCFVWCVMVPLAFCLSRFTPLSILPLYAICQSTDILKTTLGAIMIRQGKWIHNLTEQ